MGLGRQVERRDACRDRLRFPLRCARTVGRRRDLGPRWFRAMGESRRLPCWGGVELTGVYVSGVFPAGSSRLFVNMEMLSFGGLRRLRAPVVAVLRIYA